MKRLFNGFLRRLLAGLCVLPDLQPPCRVEWLEADREVLTRFLQTVTGQRLIGKLRAWEYANAIGGCDNQANYAHSAGRTAGNGEVIRLLTVELVRVLEPAPVTIPVHEGKADEDEIGSFVRRLSP